MTPLLHLDRRPAPAPACAPPGFARADAAGGIPEDFSRFATRAELAEALDRAGLTGPAREEVLSLTAAGRHAARVDAARGAAERAVRWALRGDSRPPRAELVAAATAVLLWLEVFVSAVSRRATPRPGRRPDWMGGLGSGRRSHPDAAAWDAALREAAERIAPDGLSAFAWGDDAVLVAGGTGAYGGLRPGNLAELNVLGYASRLAREGLRRAAGAPPIPPDVPLVRSSLGDWGGLVNALDEERRLLADARG